MSGDQRRGGWKWDPQGGGAAVTTAVAGLLFSVYFVSSLAMVEIERKGAGNDLMAPSVDWSRAERDIPRRVRRKISSERSQINFAAAAAAYSELDEFREMHRPISPNFRLDPKRQRRACFLRVSLIRTAIAFEPGDPHRRPILDDRLRIIGANFERGRVALAFKRSISQLQPVS